MSVSLDNAEIYLSQYLIQLDDWNTYNDDKKQRILNVAERTLMMKYPSYVIPDEAVYEFVSVLAIYENDLYKHQFNGVNSLSISEELSINFKGGKTYEELIPQQCLKMIEDANGISLRKRKFGRVI